jgi:hypothetical protein
MTILGFYKEPKCHMSDQNIQINKLRQLTMYMHNRLGFYSLVASILWMFPSAFSESVSNDMGSSACYLLHKHSLICHREPAVCNGK